MLVINKHETLIEVQCYKCKTIMMAHPMSNMNSDYFTKCDLHCKHEYELTQTQGQPMHFEFVCKTCGKYKNGED